MPPGVFTGGSRSTNSLFDRTMLSSLSMTPNKLLISVVGPDGAGKTTQAQYLVDKLRAEGHESAYWKSPAFDWVRDSIAIAGDDQNGDDVHTDALVFAAAHRMEQYLIRGMFEGELPRRFFNDAGVVRMLEGQKTPADILVGQRGIVDFYSFLLTEGEPRDALDRLIGYDRIWDGHSHRPGEYVAPNVIVYLECASQIAMSRIPREDKWEEVPFLDRLVETYEDIFKDRPRILKDAKLIRINAEPNIQEVHAQMDAAVLPVIRSLANYQRQ